jgi:hypothetical protein
VASAERVILGGWWTTQESTARASKAHRSGAVFGVANRVLAVLTGARSDVK